MFENLKKLNNGRTRVKVIGALLAIIMTFTNFTLLGSYIGRISYATDVELSKQDNRTDSNNVKFEAYLDASDKSVKESMADINSEDVKLYISVSVQNDGYLRDARLKLENTNFKIKGNEQITEIPLDIIQAEKGITLEIPILAISNETYNLGLLNMISQIKLTGEYIDGKGNVTDIESVKKVKITWKTNEVSEEDIELSQEVITNKIYQINGEAKRVVQVLVRSSVKGNKLPVKQTNIEMSIPEIGIAPEDVRVASCNTKATNGRADIEFADLETSSWEYNKEAGKVNIEILNPANEEGNVAWVKNAQDEIIVTYIYSEDVTITTFISNAKNVVEIYGIEENSTVEKMNTLELEEIQEVGDIIAVTNSVSSPIYKGNLYVNGEEEYAQVYNIYVSYKDLVNKVQIEDVEDQILDLDVSTYYKETRINKKQAINVLGEEGTINIYNAEGNELLQIVNLSEETEGDYIVVEYDEEINKILIETTEAQKEGNIEIINKKAIKVSEEEISEINKLVSNIKLLVLDENNVSISEIEKFAELELIEPKSKCNISLDKTSLSSGIENELKVTAELKTANSSERLFANPEIRIELPKEVQEAEIESITPVLYSQELILASSEIVTNEFENKELVIKIEGTQTKYPQNNAEIVIYLKVKTDSLMENQTVAIKTICINGEEKLEDTKNIELISKDESIIKNILSIGLEEPVLKAQVQKVQERKALEQESAEQETAKSEAEAQKTVEIKVNPKAMTETLYQGQIVTYEIKVKNNGKEDLENPKIIYQVPEDAVLTELTYSQGTEIKYTDKENIGSRTITLEGKLKTGQERVAEVTIKVKPDGAQIVNNIEVKNAEDQTLGTLVTEPVEVIPGDLSVIMSRELNYVSVFTEGSPIVGILLVTNNTKDTMSDLEITSKLPEETTWKEDSEDNKDWKYNAKTGEVSYTLNSISAGETKNIYFEIEVDKINNETYENTFDSMAIVTTKAGTEYASNAFKHTATKAYWKITNTALHEDTLKEGDNVKYVINVTNIGKRGGRFTLTDEIPEQINVKKVSYYFRGAEDNNKSEYTPSDNTVKVSYSAAIGETIVIEIEGTVKDLEGGVTTKKITNTAKIDLGNGEYIESNVIANTIVRNGEGTNPGGNTSNSGDNTTNPGGDIQNPGKGTYSIAGTIWLDKNKDGIRNSSEELMQSQKVLLLDGQGNKIAETLSSLTGTYKFTNLAKGEYLIALVYDTNKYVVTKYQVEEATSATNSDVVSKDILLEEKNTRVGITDTIEVKNKDILDIDMGLIENPVFDLSLNKYISKIVVTTSKDVKTYEYAEPANLAKVEIDKKEISGATLLIEYEIEIVNEGDVEGYVTDIIDYLPKELTFSSEMNPEWYKGTDNNLHYMALEPKAIKQGESQKVKLVLTRNLKDNSTGTIKNIAEIGASTNLEGIVELDSTAGNNSLNEDDISSAELIVSIKTGLPAIYVGIVIVSMVVVGIGIYIINKRVLKVKF